MDQQDTPDQPWRLPLIATKLTPPRAAGKLVARPALLALLERGAARKLTVLNAPAGFGKSTLLAQWHAHLLAAGKSVAWLSLEADDNEPGRFLAYLAAALDIGAATSIGGTAGFQGGDAVRAGVSALINRLHAAGRETILILDNAEYLKAPPILDALQYLLAHAPPQLHCIFAGSSRCALSLSQLRAADQLVEIDTADLSFSFQESSAFLSRDGAATLDSHAMRALHDSTEGWIAGLQIAVLSLRGKPLRNSALIGPSPGGAKDIRHYIEENILSGISAATRNFLLRTSILQRLNAGLCDAVSGARNAREQLRWLEADPMFLVKLDEEGSWFRYHHLFADCLREVLQAEAPDAVRALHQKAYAWFARHGRWADAAHHALESGRIDALADDIERCAMALVQAGDIRTLMDWVHRLPPEDLQCRSRLGIATAWAMTHSFQLKEAELMLANIEAQSVPSGAVETAQGLEVLAIRATIAGLRDDSALAFRLARQCPENALADDSLASGAMRNLLSFTYLLNGDFERVRILSSGAAPHARRHDDNPFASACSVALLGQSYAMQGWLDRAETIYRDAITHFEERGGRQSVAALLVVCLLAELLYERNAIAEIPGLLANRLPRIDDTCSLDPLMRAYRVLARLKLLQSQPDDARELLVRAESIGTSRGWKRLVAACAAERLNLSLAENRLDEARQILGRVRQIGHAPGQPPAPGQLHSTATETQRIVLIAEARWLIKTGQAQAAADLLQGLVEALEQTGMLLQLAGARVLLALALQAQNQAGAVDCLMDALAIGAPTGMVRTFVDEGPPMRDLLLSALGRLREKSPTDAVPGMSAHVQRLLSLLQDTASAEAAAGLISAPGARLSDQLSARERDILLLIAQGLPNKQIARNLDITTETVKWHLKNIYGKLQVTRRTEAALHVPGMRHGDG